MICGSHRPSKDGMANESAAATRTVDRGLATHLRRAAFFCAAGPPTALCKLAVTVVRQSVDAHQIVSRCGSSKGHRRAVARWSG